MLSKNISKKTIFIEINKANPAQHSKFYINFNQNTDVATKRTDDNRYRMERWRIAVLGKRLYGKIYSSEIIL